MTCDALVTTDRICDNATIAIAPTPLRVCNRSVEEDPDTIGLGCDRGARGDGHLAGHRYVIVSKLAT